jgi:hypothetical protein
MKRTLPAKEVEVCDICHHDGFLMQCNICNGMFCRSCEGHISGCWVGPMVCRTCAHREDVQEVVRKHADEITPIIERRTKALCSLPKTNSGLGAS